MWWLYCHTVLSFDFFFESAGSAGFLIQDVVRLLFDKREDKECFFGSGSCVDSPNAWPREVRTRSRKNFSEFPLFHLSSRMCRFSSSRVTGLGGRLLWWPETEIIDDDENPGPFRPLIFPLFKVGDIGMCRKREFDVDRPVTCFVRDVDLERKRFDLGEHTEHESSVQLTELFDGDLDTYLKKIKYKSQKYNIGYCRLIIFLQCRVYILYVLLSMKQRTCRYSLRLRFHMKL